MVASQTPPTSGRGSTAGGGPAALPLVATTTVFLVSGAASAEALSPDSLYWQLGCTLGMASACCWQHPDTGAWLVVHVTCKSVLGVDWP